MPHNPSQAKQLEHAEQLIAAGHPDQALERLEFVLTNSDHATVRTSDGRPGLVAWEANRLLARLPATASKPIGCGTKPRPTQLYHDAQATGNWDQVMDVATRYFHTQTGKQAANAIGNFHFDRGEFGLASIWYVRCLGIGTRDVSQDPKWRLKVALALAAIRQHAAPATNFLHGLQQNGRPTSTSAATPVKPEAWLRRFGRRRPIHRSRSAGMAAVPGKLPPHGDRGRRRSAAVVPLVPSDDAEQAGPRPNGIAGARPGGHRTRADSDGVSADGEGPRRFPHAAGVHVLDAATGRLLWETRAEFSEDSLIAGYRSPFDFDNGGFAFRRMRGGMWRTDFSSGESAADGHPLTGLLYRNANFGLLASDGARLFVIEDDAVVMHGPAGTGFQLVGDSYESQRRTPGNRLAAYDLATGRETWAIGGPANGESFDLPLAGSFFFGAPLVDGGELFVVGEQDLDIRLYALDPAHGPSPLVAASGPFGRQNRAGLGPSLVDRAGRVFERHSGLPDDRRLAGRRRSSRSFGAVDGSLRSAAARCRTPRARTGANALVPPSPLNEQWCPSAPVIAGNDVVYTPSEEPVLICVDLSSGLTRWQVQKGEDQLYLAGVDDERVLVVGKTSVTALSLETGTVQWTAPIEESQGPPSGRGVIAKGIFYLPLQERLALGRLAGRWQSRRDVPASSRNQAVGQPRDVPRPGPFAGRHSA